jgi:ABC-2 type transport system ATP-binding protein
MFAAEITQVTKRFGQKLAVDQLSLKVPQGSIYGFIGPNGSGKTTTLRMMLNILLPDSGSIQLFNSSTPAASCHRIGYLPEERGLYRRMKVREHLQFLAELRGFTQPNPTINLWLERLDLLAYANKKVETLSKGMSQKVQFIAAALNQPEFLILDEPFSGLDPVNADTIRQAILELRQSGSTIIFSTHDMTAAESLCDFIFMIFQGRKVLDGTLSDIQSQYPAETIRVRIPQHPSLLQSLPGVAHVEQQNHHHTLKLLPNANPQTILQSLASQSPVELFEIAKPTLHEIFVRIARPNSNPTP